MMTTLVGSLDFRDLGRRMHKMCAELYPICRSITGDGVRQTLMLVARELPLERHEFRLAPTPSTGPSLRSGTSATRTSSTELATESVTSDARTYT